MGHEKQHPEMKEQHPEHIGDTHGTAAGPINGSAGHGDHAPGSSPKAETPHPQRHAQSHGPAQAAAGQGHPHGDPHGHPHELHGHAHAEAHGREHAVAHAVERHGHHPAEAPAHGHHGNAGAGYFLTALIALAGGAAGAWGFESFGAKPEPAAAPPPAAVAARNSVPAIDTTQFVKAADLRGMQHSIAQISERIDHLQERLAAMPMPQQPPDLKELQNQVDELARDEKSLADVPARLSALDERITAIDKALMNLRAQTKTNSGQPRTSFSSAVKPGPASRTLDRFPPGSELAQGAEYFQQGQYSRALQVFKRLEDSSPDDARVWYFAALANGLSAGKWNGECARLAEQGVEWERAGKPDSTVVDATFADLTKATGKDWLASHRKHVDSPR